MDIFLIYFQDTPIPFNLRDLTRKMNRKMIIILRIDENCFEAKKNDYNIENR